MIQNLPFLLFCVLTRDMLRLLTNLLFVSFVLFSTLSSAEKCKEVFRSLTPTLPKSNPFSQIDSFYESGIPFDKIKKEHFIPALMAFIKEAENKVERIKKQPTNFKNTIEGLHSLDRFGVIFSIQHILGTVNSQIRTLDSEMYTLYQNFANKLFFDKELYEKVKKIAEDEVLKKTLNTEKLRLIKETLRGFTNSGVQLSPEKRKALVEIQEKRQRFVRKFEENVKNEQNTWAVFISKKEHLKGIPKRLVKLMKQRAVQAGHPDKWLINYFSNVGNHLESRSLRESLEREMAKTNTQGEYDNSDLLLEILNLRHQEAQIKGFKNYSITRFKEIETMAKKPQKVSEFLEQLKKYHKEKALEELKKIEQMAKEDGISDLKLWDAGFYAQKYRKRYFKFDHEELLPYFELNRVIDGMFTIAGRLFDLQFKETKKYSLFHESVKVYEVYTKRGRFLGVLYLDLFTREEKRGGAWALSLLKQNQAGGKKQRASTVLVTNIEKATTGDTLLRTGQVKNLFHELGHSLHNLLSEVRYRDLSGTQVPIDFVEFPSQLMEKWAFHPDSIILFAKHHETGEVIPDSFIEYLNQKDPFFNMVELFHTKIGWLDLVWHQNTRPEKIESVEDFEKQTIEDFELFKDPGCSSTISCNLTHITSGLYPSAYYSYQWSRFFVEDAFKLFKEKGIFNKKLAYRLKKVLQRGGSEEPLILYEQFKGEPFDIRKYVLKKKGVTTFDDI